MVQDGDRSNKSAGNRKRRLPEEGGGGESSSISNNNGFGVFNGNNHNSVPFSAVVSQIQESRSAEAAKQLLCGGVAGSVAKSVTAPLSRLTILFQVHSLVTTKEHRPKFAMTLRGGVQKIIERGGVLSLWKGNMTSVLHRFPYSAINFYGT